MEHEITLAAYMLGFVEHNIDFRGTPHSINGSYLGFRGTHSIEFHGSSFNIYGIHVGVRGPVTIFVEHFVEHHLIKCLVLYVLYLVRPCQHILLEQLWFILILVISFSTPFGKRAYHILPISGVQFVLQYHNSIIVARRELKEVLYRMSL